MGGVCENAEKMSSKNYFCGEDEALMMENLVIDMMGISFWVWEFCTLWSLSFNNRAILSLLKFSNKNCGLMITYVFHSK